MQALASSNNSYDFEAFNAAGQVWNGSTFVSYAILDYASYRIAATKLGNANDANIQCWFSATAPAGTVRYQLRLRGASLALSYIVWTENGPRETWSKVIDTSDLLTFDKG